MDCCHDRLGDLVNGVGGRIDGNVLDPGLLEDVLQFARPVEVPSQSVGIVFMAPSQALPDRSQVHAKPADGERDTQCGLVGITLSAAFYHTGQNQTECARLDVVARHGMQIAQGNAAVEGIIGRAGPAPA